jgi:mitogen-activated protein kinase kinase 1
MDPQDPPRKKAPINLQPLITPLRTKRGAQVGGVKPKPKGFGNLALQVNVPEKKIHDPKDFEITDSGTFSFGNVKIAMNGLKNEESNTHGGAIRIPTTSSSGSVTTPETSDSDDDQFYRPEHNYGDIRSQYQQPLVTRGTQPPKLTIEPKNNNLNTELQQVEERFRQIQSSTTTLSQTPPKRLDSMLGPSDGANTPPRKFSSDQNSPQVKLSPRPHQDILYDDLTILKKSKLGSGATANVIRVLHTKDQKPYALKIVPLYQGDIQPKQIISEIQSLYESMSCPYIVRFYEAFHREGSIRILLEYMDCGSLDDVYRTVGKIPENVLSQITFQILQGLVYLETKKIVHRDIKPANILLNRDGNAKISDFGMSKQLTASLQAFKTFQGTFMYMSPERLKGEEHGFDSDIWSLGVSIAECAIGRFPFDLEQFNLWNVLKCITENGLNIQNGECSPELLQFVRACTQVDPVARPNAAALLQYEFITKHNQRMDKVATTEWIATVYLPERRRKQKLKHSQKLAEKEQQQQSPQQNIIQKPQITNTAGVSARKFSGGSQQRLY